MNIFYGVVIFALCVWNIALTNQISVNIVTIEAAILNTQSAKRDYIDHEQILKHLFTQGQLHHRWLTTLDQVLYRAATKLGILNQESNSKTKEEQPDAQ